MLDCTNLPTILEYSHLDKTFTTAREHIDCVQQENSHCNARRNQSLVENDLCLFKRLKL